MASYSNGLPPFVCVCVCEDVRLNVIWIKSSVTCDHRFVKNYFRIIFFIYHTYLHSWPLDFGSWSIGLLTNRESFTSQNISQDSRAVSDDPLGLLSQIPLEIHPVSKGVDLQQNRHFQQNLTPSTSRWLPRSKYLNATTRMNK